MSDIEELKRLADYQGDDRVVLWTDYLAAQAQSERQQTIMPTGFTEFDFHMGGGLQLGEVVTVSGATGQGKTLFTKSLARNFVQTGVPLTFFSFEVGAAQLLADFKDAGLTEANGLYVPLKLQPGFVEWVAERSLEALLKFDSRVIVIDHLHYVIEMNMQKNMSMNIGAVMRNLKVFAIKHNKLVVIISHQQTLKPGEEPSIETIRDSSFIAQESDAVIVVHRKPDALKEPGQSFRGKDTMRDLRPEEFTFDLGFATVKIEKARRSGAYRKRLTFQKRGGFLECL